MINRQRHGLIIRVWGVLDSANSSSPPIRRQRFLDGATWLLVALSGSDGKNNNNQDLLMPSLRPILLSIAALFAVALMATACETGPPVQEMSDARQAIAVAREAGAEALAAAELLEAEQFLESAEQKLTDEKYADARRDALQAKSKAQSARELSESQQPDNN